MWKKIFSAALVGLIAFGIWVYCTRPDQEKTGGAASDQGRIGDLRLRFKDFEEVTPLQHSAKTAKTAETASAVPQKDTGAEVQKAGAGYQPQQPSLSDANPQRSQIEQKYISRLQSLASGYEGKLNGLVSAALNEYASVRKANPNADTGQLVNKYYNSARALEAECDSQFYSILASFEGELKANSFPLDLAVQARDSYEARKSSRAAQITTGRP